MLFPEGGLAVSVAATVWIGVIIVCLLNLRLGWSLSAIIVPGFLTPLLIVKPFLAVVDIVQGILAYALMKFISEFGVVKKHWDNVFGKDRFFFLILSATILRLLFDGWLTGIFASWLQEHFNYQVNYAANFYSYGLIVSALIANIFWQEGVTKQIIPFSVTLLLSYILVRYGLMEFSNFRISHIAGLYNNIEELFSSSPKMYIILLVTTLISTHMSSRYGWDYGGILIAGLLALQWYEPVQILLTLVEAAIIYFLSDLLLKTKFFESRNIVKARKILLFFNVGIIYKIVLGHFVMHIFSETRALEFYGFGYMISTFIALKMHDSGNPMRIGIIMLITSFVGLVAGSFLSFVLTFITGGYAASPIKVDRYDHVINARQVPNIKGHLPGIMEEYRVNNLKISKEAVTVPTLSELYSIDTYVITPLTELIRKPQFTESDLSELDKINGYADIYGYQISFLDDLATSQKLLVLSPKEQNDRTRNWGIYIFRLGATNDQVIEVPRPFDEANTFEFALSLFQKSNAKYLLMGGSLSNVNKDRSADLTRPQSKDSLYHLINQALSRDYKYQRPIIQLRGYSLNMNSSVTPDKDLLIAFSDGAFRPEQFTGGQREIIKIVESMGASYRTVNSDENTSGYEVGELFLSKYLLQTQNNELAVLWLSPSLRSSFRSPSNDFLLLSYYNTLGIQAEKASLQEYLAKNNLKVSWVPSELVKIRINKYLDTADIVALKNLIGTENYYFKHLILDDDGRDYLSIFDKDNSLLGLVSLSGTAEEKDNYFISKNETSRLDLSSKRLILFKEP